MTDTNETVTVQMTLPTPPEGWEYTGEYRVPNKGEYYAADNGSVVEGAGAHACHSLYPIIRKKKWYPKEGDVVWVLANRSDTAGLVVTNMEFDRGRSIIRRLYASGYMYRTCEAASAALDRVEMVLAHTADELNNTED